MKENRSVKESYKLAPGSPAAAGAGFQDRVSADAPRKKIFYINSTQKLWKICETWTDFRLWRRFCLRNLFL